MMNGNSLETETDNANEAIASEVRTLLETAKGFRKRNWKTDTCIWLIAIYRCLVRRAYIPAILLLCCAMICRRWSIDNHPGVFSLFVSCAAGIICWGCFDLIPSFRSREWYRKYLDDTYQSVKRSIAEILLDNVRFSVYECKPQYRETILDSLTKFSSFREFFHSGENGPWNRTVRNWTQETIQDMFFHFNELVHAIETTLNNCPWVDKTSHSNLRRICFFLRERQKLSCFRSEPNKYVSEYLVFPIMANWSLIKGARIEDPIQKAIEEL